MIHISIILLFFFAFQIFYIKFGYNNYDILFYHEKILKCLLNHLFKFFIKFEKKSKRTKISMSVVYFHLSGFIFADRKYANDKLYFIVDNNMNSNKKRVDFTFHESKRLRKSYNLAVVDPSKHKFTISLYKKGILKDSFLGSFEIPVKQLPLDAVTFNTLPITYAGPKTSPIALRLAIHYSSKEEPYKAPTVNPVLPQIDITQYMCSSYLKGDALLDNNIPLLSRHSV